MEKTVVIICIVVVLLGILTAYTGFEAEAHRIKFNQIHHISPQICEYPKTPAVGLAVTAVVSLFAAHLIMIISIIYMRFPFKDSPRRCCSVCIDVAAICCFSFSWSTFLWAFIFFVDGASFSNRHRRKTWHGYDYDCSILRDGVFSSATIESIISLVVGMLAFLLCNYSKTSNRVRDDIDNPPPQPPPPLV